MTNTIILRKDKSLTKTTFREFYHNEHYADKIQFLLDTDFMDDDITTYTITLFVTLPKYNESTEEPVTHKAKYLTLDEELYKEKYRIELPVTITLTENVGDVIMYLQFTKENEEGEIDRHLTDTAIVTVSPTASITSIDTTDSESYDVLTKLQEDIEELKENKIDKYYDYDASTGELQLYANGEEAGDEVLIDQEVSLVNW